MAPIPPSPSPRLPEIAGIVFDFDGTLVDTESPTIAAWQEVYRQHGRELSLADWQRALGTHEGFDPHTHLIGLTAGSYTGDPLEVRIEIRRRCAGEPLRPGVEALLNEARQAGLRIAVASSSSLGWVELWLAHHGIRPLFDRVIGRDLVRQVKPAPDLFLLAAAELGLPPAACLAIEDSPNGVLAARSAGMRCLLVPNPVTAPLPFPAVDLTLDSLEGVTLAALLEQLGTASPV
jgi:beta-phosphoglucomutase-like phosphatase (HAD superfamily)